jgi:hypothetical protein
MLPNYAEASMTKLAIAAIIPLFSGFMLMAQETETQTTQTTFTGTLMDAGCVSKHSEHTETTNTPEGSSTTKTTSEEENCPVTTETSDFVLATPDHHYIHFDPASEPQIVEMVKTKHAHGPMKVTVVGEKRDGDVVVVKSIE